MQEEKKTKIRKIEKWFKSQGDSTEIGLYTEISGGNEFERAKKGYSYIIAIGGAGILAWEIGEKN